MAVPEHLTRVADRIDLERVMAARVVVIGLGTVGSPIVAELAACGVRNFRLVDGDTLEMANLSRHALDVSYVGTNKAEAMANFARKSYPPPMPDVEYFATYVDDAMSNKELDTLIEDADLVIAATDERKAQRRIAERALANDVPAIFPGLDPEGGGEVFVSLGPNAPCYLCWDAFRPADADLRAVSALNVEALSVVALAAQLAIGVLDPASSFARRFAPAPRERTPRTLFLLSGPFAVPQFGTVLKRPNCPMCQIGPGSSGAGLQDAEQFARDNQGPTVAGLWTLAIFGIALVTGSPVAVFMFSVTVIGLVAFALRPSPSAIIARARASGGLGVVGGVVVLWLLVAAMASGSALAILVLGAALAGTAYLLFRG